MLSQTATRWTPETGGCEMFSGQARRSYPEVFDNLELGWHVLLSTFTHSDWSTQKGQRANWHIGENEGFGVRSLGYKTYVYC